MSSPAIEVSGVVKDYRGLRPLRMSSLFVRQGQRVAIRGLDQAAAEVFVNLVNGAVLPDTGEVRVFGSPTALLTSAADWLASLDAFGVLTERAVLLEGSSLAQNLALPFSLEIDPMPDDLRRRVEVLAGELELDPASLDTRVGDAPPSVRLRVHLGRAIALDPRLLLVEHPTLSLPREDVNAFAALVRRVAEARNLTVVALTDDQQFADVVADTRLTLDPGTGSLSSAPTWRQWFRRL